MKIKRIIVAVILLCITLSLSSCSKEVTIDGVIYRLCDDNYYTICYISDFETESSTSSIYVPDTVNGIPVKEEGIYGYFTRALSVSYSHTERIYLPWSIEESYGIKFSVLAGKEGTLKYVITPSTKCYHNRLEPYDRFYVLPRVVYEKEENTQFCIPANISYFFNYDESPNENYFFVDLLEETGKLTKPPYDPNREGYTFVGWYTEPECVNSFNFEEDSVTINFDEEGHRIYEEFCLYAKWDKE